MSNLTKTLLIVAVVVALSMVGLFIFTLPHWWLRVGEAETRVGSTPFGIATVYRSIDGNLLFRVQEDSIRDQYIYYPADGKIGIPNGGQFIFFPFSSFVAVSKDAQPSVVFSDDRIKVETDMNIMVDGNWLEFDTRGGRRIQADLNNY